MTSLPPHSEATGAAVMTSVEKVVGEWRAAMEGVSAGLWLTEKMSNGYGYAVMAGARFLCSIAARGAGIRGTSARSKADASWIARCSPAGIAPLLALIEQQAAELKVKDEQVKRLTEMYRAAELRSEPVVAVNHWKARATTAEAERDEARAKIADMSRYMVPLHKDGTHVFIDGPGDVELDHGGKLRAERDELLREKERMERRLDRLTGHTEMVIVNGAGFAAPKPVAQRLAELQVKLDQARDLGMAYSTDAKSAEGALIAIRRRTIFGPGLSTSDLLDLTAGVAGVSCADRPCPHAPTYDAGLCCGHPDDCTFVSPAAPAPIGEE